jgi:type IV secretory pathway component VirB8
MNDAPEDFLLEPPDPEFVGVREQIFHEVIAAHTAADRFARERWRAGWWVGGIGATIGLVASCAMMVVVAYHRPQIRYREIDPVSGVIRASYPAADAPRHFNTQVIQHYLSEYISARESFVWQIDAVLDHRIKIMSSPEEQRRYQMDREKRNPGKLYGAIGYARVTRWIGWRQAGKEKNTYEYEVQFELGELLAADPTRAREVRKTARIVFEFHPELMMSEADRIDNEAGLVVFFYNSSED